MSVAAKVREAVKEAGFADAAKAHALVLSKSYCPFCTKALQHLKAAGMAYEVIQMDQVANGDSLHAKVKALSGHNTVPAVFLGDKFVGGCSELTAIPGGQLSKY